MTRDAYALYTGLFLLILIAASAGITVWLGRYGDESDTYVITTSGSVSGLVEESTVLYRGVNAGKVESIRFDPDDVRNILVTINVRKGLPITRGTYAKLRIQGLTGLAQIELGDNGENPQALSTDPANPSRIEMRPSLVDKLSDSGGNILIRAEELIARLNSVLNGDGQQHIQHILANLDAATAKLAALEVRVDQAFAQVPQLSAGAQKTMGHLNDLTLRTNHLMRESNSLIQSTEALLQEGRTAANKLNSSTLPRLEESLNALSQAADELRKAAQRFNNDPQAIFYGMPPSPPGPGEPGFSGSP